MTGPLFRYSFVLNDNEDINLENNWENLATELSKTLDEISKRWIFQLEQGKETNRFHFQGRFSLITKKRKCECLKLFPNFKTISLLPESTAGEEESTFYCMKKDDTFRQGPWNNEKKKIYIPRQITEIKNLHPWQQQIIDISKVWDTRHINIIFDKHGNNGKSTLCTYMGVFGLGKLLPFCNDYKDILRMTYDVGVQKAYLIDIPRAISKERLFQFYGAIETIKSGYCYDDRYKFQDRYFDCPNVFVFTNVLPDESLLSKDRWNYWTIKDHTLCPITSSCVLD